MKNTTRILTTLAFCASLAAHAETGSASLHTRQSVMDAQQALVNQGFSISVDGVSGPQTRNALRQFQARQGLPETGTLDNATMEALRSGGAAAQPSASDTSAE